MTDHVYWNGQLHAPGCPALEGVEARVATPSDHQHADRCQQCADGTTQYQSHERGDVRNDDHLMTDGGVELRDGETRDDTHARRNAEMLATLRRERFSDLPESEQAVLEILVGEGGRLPAAEVVTLVAYDTGLTPAAARSAGNRLTDKDLIESHRIPTDPRQRRWLLTDEGRAWVRAGGDA